MVVIVVFQISRNKSLYFSITFVLNLEKTMSRRTREYLSYSTDGYTRDMSRIGCPPLFCCRLKLVSCEKLLPVSLHPIACLQFKHSDAFPLVERKHIFILVLETVIDFCSYYEVVAMLKQFWKKRKFEQEFAYYVL